MKCQGCKKLVGKTWRVMTAELKRKSLCYNCLASGVSKPKQ